jgi:hypothetical protein
MIKNNKEVLIVHCIDTEGPLNETIDATFDRLKHSYGIKMKPSKDNLNKIQNEEYNFNGNEQTISQAFSKENLNYNNNWKKLKKLIDHGLSKKFRSRFKDSYNNNWIYNWFCVDHVDYDINPRSRSIGFHKIFDFYYKEIKKKHSNFKDGLHFHFHPHPFIKNATYCATSWIGHSDKLYQVLCRRLIDRNWFPSVNRPGFQVNRPDSHWFLEQYIPFDYSNLSIKLTSAETSQNDFSMGRSGDWRRAPKSWIPYHPDHDDYQKIGNCRRWIARCLNVGTRSYLLKQNDISLAFDQARKYGKSLLSFANHDFRDFTKDVSKFYEDLIIIKKKYPDVKFRFCEAKDGIRRVLKIKKESPLKLNVVFDKKNNNQNRIIITANKKIFGPQPFLAIKTKENEYFNDNLDFQINFKQWSYTFDNDTIPLKKLSKFGVAANLKNGNTTVVVFDYINKKKIITNYN